MAQTTTKYIWHNGRMVPWEKATVHVMAHALHYASSVFEGVRVYETPDGSRFFRLRDHSRRLFNSAKVYRMRIPYTEDEINEACREAVVKNGLTGGAYVRPLAYRGCGTLGVAPDESDSLEVAIIAIEWGAYLGAEGLEKGVDVCISSWQRVAANTIPAGAKAAGNYLSSQLISMEAKRLGFAEGIGLSPDGLVSEGAGENLFLVQDGILYTPPAASAILTGITRDTVMKLAAAKGLEVVEQAIPREMLYFADELFFTGTAAEITPIRSVDRIEVGNGKRGPVTRTLQEAFFGLFDGSTADEWGWLAKVQRAYKAPVAV